MVLALTWSVAFRFEIDVLVFMAVDRTLLPSFADMISLGREHIAYVRIRGLSRLTMRPENDLPRVQTSMVRIWTDLAEA